MDRQVIIDSHLLCDPFLSTSGGPWGGIFSIPYIGRTIDWYVHNVIAPGEGDGLRIFNQSAAQAPPGAGGLEIDLRAAPRHVDGSRANISRAIMEGAARLLNDKIRDLGTHGFRYDQAVLVGGPASSPVWPAIIAETTGIDLAVGSRHAGACGAAMLAGIAVGLYQDEHDALAAKGGKHVC
jgi:sugar (pentulose or hexulose) kinase